LLAMVTSARQSAWPLNWPIDDLTAAGLRQPCLVLGALRSLCDQDRAGVTANLRSLFPWAGRPLPRHLPPPHRPRQPRRPDRRPQPARALPAGVGGGVGV